MHKSAWWNVHGSVIDKEVVEIVESRVSIIPSKDVEALLEDEAHMAKA
jgi:hypothetical protein